MKKSSLIYAMTIMTVISNVFVAKSQETSIEPTITEECANNVITSRELVKNKQYEEAYEPWRAAYETCPNANKAIYTDGAKIIEAFYNATFDDKEKENGQNLLLNCKISVSSILAMIQNFQLHIFLVKRVWLI